MYNKLMCIKTFIQVIVFLSIIFCNYSSFADNIKNYKIENAWSQIGENNSIYVRAIVSGKNGCPSIVFYENTKFTEVSMYLRENYFPEKFPVQVCEILVPPKTTRVTLNNKELPIIKPLPSRILLIGDTGCRLKKDMIQNCNDENSWAFKKIATEAIKMNPDIIIHLGDYHYRETPCPKGNTECMGATPGDNWQSWNEDFFSPAKEFLYAAPLLFIRGDHESCGRAGEGWFYFLDPRKNVKECKKYTEPYKVTLGSVNLISFDSSSVLDRKINPKNLDEYSKELNTVNIIKGSTKNWFVSHKPVWGVGVPREKGILEYTNELKTKELQSAVNNVPFDSSFDILLAGHIHLFQLLSLGKQYPPQLVSGNGGTLIEYYMPKTSSRMIIDNKIIEYIKTIENFGFTILEIEKNDVIKAVVYDVLGKIKTVCQISSKKEVFCNN